MSERPIYPVPKPAVVMKERRQPKQRTPVKKVREKPRPGRLKGKDMTDMRDFVYLRDRGICFGCKKWVSKQRCHLAHKRNKRMWGDNPKNACIKCAHCHLVIEHAQGGAQKICPPKPKMEKLGG